MPTDPLARFRRWFDEARRARIPLPEAMALATADRAGHPSVRFVLLKQADGRGFVFFTDARSRKGRHAEPFGGTYPHKERLEPLPAVKPKAAGATIPLYRPDIVLLAERDIPFTRVLEERFPDVVEAQPEVLAYHYKEAGLYEFTRGLDYASIVATSERVAWTVDEIFRDRRFDATKRIVPDSWVRTQHLAFLDAQEQQTLNHIRAFSYVHLEGVSQL